MLYSGEPRPELTRSSKNGSGTTLIPCPALQTLPAELGMRRSQAAVKRHTQVDMCTCAGVQAPTHIDGQRDAIGRRGEGIIEFAPRYETARVDFAVVGQARLAALIAAVLLRLACTACAVLAAQLLRV